MYSVYDVTATDRHDTACPAASYAMHVTQRTFGSYHLLPISVGGAVNVVNQIARKRICSRSVLFLHVSISVAHLRHPRTAERINVLFRVGKLLGPKEHCIKVGVLTPLQRGEGVGEMLSTSVPTHSMRASLKLLWPLVVFVDCRKE